MTLQEKALMVIDHLVSDDLSAFLEYNLAMHREIKLSQEDVKVLSRKLCTIYTVAHSASKSHICYEVHDDWRKNTLKLYKQLKKEVGVK